MYKAKQFVAPEPDRSRTGGQCYICKKILITSLEASSVMTKSLVRITREERVHRDFLTKFMAKDMQSRTSGDITLLNRAVPRDPAAEVIAMSCGHLYHRRCFKEYSDKYKVAKQHRLVECPLCRKTVLIGNAVTFDTRPLDCGHDKLPVPVAKEIKTLQNEGLTMLSDLTSSRLNCHRGLNFYMEQMFRIKTFKREILEYYEPFWLNDTNIDKLRARRDSLKKEANDREVDNINRSILFLSKLEHDKRLTPAALACLRRLRLTREGVDSFRALVKAIRKLHVDPVTGTLNTQGFMGQLMTVLSTGFKSPVEP